MSQRKGLVPATEQQVARSRSQYFLAKMATHLLTDFLSNKKLKFVPTILKHGWTNEYLH